MIRSEWKTFCAILIMTSMGCAPARAQLVAGALPPDARLPRIGILVPVGPPDYRILMDAFHKERIDTLGPFSFQVGTIYSTPVVVSLLAAGEDGPLLRSLSAQSMFEHYNIKVVIYAGTSGANIPPDQMRIGDIVLDAENVDFGNFKMMQSGEITGGEFDSPSQTRKFGALFADPSLLGDLACSATRVARHTDLPDWLNPGFQQGRPSIFYFGVQGTSTMWITNLEFMEKINKSFHVIDQDGDWYSNLAATLYGVAFIEVSVIANSSPEFPQDANGRPKSPAGEDPSSFIAQRISNRIALDLIDHFGTQMLKGKFSKPTRNPFPPEYFADPTNPQNLLQGKQCD